MKNDEVVSFQLTPHPPTSDSLHGHNITLSPKQ